jgi:glycosyltransferase involved in cell wall biosynthesis
MSRANGNLKLLIYGEYFLPVVGGVQTAMNLLAKGLVKLNSRKDKDGDVSQIEVTIATRTAANGMDDSGFPYCVVRRPGLRRLMKLIREADVIHVAGPCLLPMAISWLIGKPFVVEHHGYQAICPNGLLFREPSRTVCPGYFSQKQYGKCVRCTSETMGFTGGVRSVLLNFPRRWLSKKAATNITISDHVATRLKLPRSRTIYYGIEESNSVSSRPSATPSRLLEIAYVGRLVVEKGAEILLHAAQLFRGPKNGIKIVFIGDGPERRRLEELAESLQLTEVVRFTGDLRGPDLDRAVNNVGVVVMPSLCEETAGLSAIEQMMRGRVVIAADIGGLSEVVGDAGLKFAAGDSQALAECIKSVVADPSLAASLGSTARVRAMRLFRRDSMIQGHVSLYLEAWLDKMRTRGLESVDRRTRD